MEIAAQIISIIASGIMIFSFQLKSNRRLFLCQVVSGVLFAVSYYLLGALTGCLMNVVGFARMGILALGEKYRKWYLLVLLELGFLVSTIVSYEGYLSLIVLAAQFFATLALWTDNGKLIRIVQVSAISPLWLLYNFLVMSIGGIVCEAFNMLSIGISFLRHGKEGFVK